MLIRSSLIVALMLATATTTIATAPHKIKHKHIEVKTPDDEIAQLKEGNSRFLHGKMINTDYGDQIEANKAAQHPPAMVLSCIDSRIPPEIIFDQGIGNLFVDRVAGNIDDSDVLGSMEFAVKVKGIKLIVVMGHDHCGAVEGCIDNVQFGSLTQLLNHIRPAIKGDPSNRDMMVEQTARNNVRLTINDILSKSDIISAAVKSKDLKIVGAYYNLASGKVEFLD